MALVPFLVLFLLCEQIPISMIWSLVIFSAASITDYLDGKIARSRNLITNFGKFLDPMADKILVISAMICFGFMGLCSPVVLIIVIAREFMVSSLRLVAASQGIVLAAGWSGKLKPASQMVTIVVILLLLSIEQLFKVTCSIPTISHILMWITGAIALYSGIEYMVKNRKLIDENK